MSVLIYEFDRWGTPDSLQGVELLTCCGESILPRGMERDVCDGLALALECVHDLAGL